MNRSNGIFSHFFKKLFCFLHFLWLFSFFFYHFFRFFQFFRFFNLFPHIRWTLVDSTAMIKHNYIYELIGLRNQSDVFPFLFEFPKQKEKKKNHEWKLHNIHFHKHKHKTLELYNNNKYLRSSKSTSEKRIWFRWFYNFCLNQPKERQRWEKKFRFWWIWIFQFFSFLLHKIVNSRRKNCILTAFMPTFTV